MSREITDRIRDMLEAIDQIAGFVEGLDEEAFVADLKSYRAVLATLTILGEAARQPPKDLRARYPQIPWHDIITTRHIVVHVYHAVSERIIWETVRRDLPELRGHLETMLRDLSRPA